MPGNLFLLLRLLLSRNLRLMIPRAYMPAGERRIGYEDLISYNPDVLFVVYFNEEQRLQIIELFRCAEFSSLKSVKNQRVYPIPFDHMYTPAIKTIDGLRMIRDGLYPDLEKKEGEKE